MVKGFEWWESGLRVFWIPNFELCHSPLSGPMPHFGESVCVAWRGLVRPGTEQDVASCGSRWWGLGWISVERKLRRVCEFCLENKMVTGTSSGSAFSFASSPSRKHRHLRAKRTELSRLGVLLGLARFLGFLVARLEFFGWSLHVMLQIIGLRWCWALILMRRLFLYLV